VIDRPIEQYHLYRPLTWGVPSMPYRGSVMHTGVGASPYKMSAAALRMALAFGLQVRMPACTEGWAGSGLTARSFCLHTWGCHQHSSPGASKSLRKLPSQQQGNQT
jgi:hypothetical protein